MSKITIRKATSEDAALILSFVHELAKEEKAEHEVETSKEQLAKTLFGKNSTSHVIICEAEGVPIGHAVYFFNYSTWQGKNGLYIEDLYILGSTPILLANYFVFFLFFLFFFSQSSCSLIKSW